MARSVVVDKVEEVLAGAGLAGVTIYGENSEGVTPSDGSPYIVVQYPYCNSQQISIGSPGDNLWRDEGTIRIVIHVMRNAGATQGRAWADQIADLFRGKDFTVLQTQAPSAAVSDDRSSDGPYYVLAFVIPYRHDYYA